MGLLAAVLYLILAAALDAAGHVENLSIVVPVTAGAFFWAPYVLQPL